VGLPGPERSEGGKKVSAFHNARTAAGGTYLGEVGIYVDMDAEGHAADRTSSRPCGGYRRLVAGFS
jgi:hypothetical protein